MSRYHGFLRVLFVGLLGLGLAGASVGTAHADSISYNVLGTFGNGQQLTGQITYNTTLGAVTSSDLTLSGSQFNSVLCNSSGGGCSLVAALFGGPGNSIEILAGLFSPNWSPFLLTVNGRSYTTNVSWSVPEEPFGVELLIVLAAMSALLPFRAVRGMLRA